MAYIQLLTAVFLLITPNFLNTSDVKSTLLLKAPMVPLGALILMDALSRLNII